MLNAMFELPRPRIRPRSFPVFENDHLCATAQPAHSHPATGPSSAINSTAPYAALLVCLAKERCGIGRAESIIARGAARLRLHSTRRCERERSRRPFVASRVRKRCVRRQLSLARPGPARHSTARCGTTRHGATLPARSRCASAHRNKLGRAKGCRRSYRSCSRARRGAVRNAQGAEVIKSHTLGKKFSAVPFAAAMLMNGNYVPHTRR